MLKKEKKLIITYYTSDMAFATEKACKKEAIKGELISAPRKLSADCGISFSTDVANNIVMKDLLNKYNIEYDKMTEL